MSLKKYGECRRGKDLEGDYRRLFRVSFSFFVQVEEPRKPAICESYLHRPCLDLISSRICVCRN